MNTRTSNSFVYALLFFFFSIVIDLSLLPAFVHAQTTSSRFFQKHNTWYEKIPSIPIIHPDSANVINNIKKYSHPLGIIYTKFSHTIFYARQDTPKVVVEVRAAASKALGWNVVPIPSEARPSGFGTDGYSDGHMVIISHDRKSAWDFYQAERLSAGSWKAAVVRRWNLDTDGVNSPYDGLGNVKMCPTPILHGLVTYEEIKRGYIDHAMIVAVNNAKTNYWGHFPCEAYVGGFNTNPYPPQGGMRIQLDPAVNIDTLGLSPVAKMVAKAMQEYGMISVDNAGTTDFDIYFEDVSFRPDKVSWQGILPNDLGKIPRDKLRIVQSPGPPFAGFESEYTPVRVRTKQSADIYFTPFNLSSPRSTLPAGSLGTVKSEPVTLSGVTWWFVDYDDMTPNSHSHGWTRADRLESLTAQPASLLPPTGLRTLP
jgi:hypothetical protein